MSRKLLVVATALLYSTVAFANPHPSYNVKDIIALSDLICVGRIVKDVHDPNRGSIIIQAIVKGQSSSRTVEVNDAKLKTIPVYGDRLFLIHSVEGNVYSFTSSSTPSLPAFPPYEVGSDVNGTIAQIESNVVTAESTPSADRYFALSALTQLSGQNSLGKLDAIATNEALPIDLRLQAKADLVSWEDDKYTDEVLQALNLDTVLANPVLKNNLAVVVRDHVHDPRHASLLTGLSTSRDDLVRRAAATALSSMSSPGLLPVFARLLSDSDREVRYMAVTGIAKQSGTSAEIPSQMKFFANEPQLIREARESASTNPARR